MTVIISGDNGVSDVDGSAGTPAIRGTDANTGIFFGADQVGVATNGVERVEFGNSETVFNDGGADVDFRVEGDTDANLLFVDASTDRIGIGTTSPSSKLTVSGGSVFASGANRGVVLGEDQCVILGDSASAGSANMLFYTANAERARITSGGTLLVGTTTAAATAKVEAYKTGGSTTCFLATQGDSGDYCYTSRAFNNGGVFYHFNFTEAGTQRGSITSNGGSTSYLTGSDYRLKDNIAPLTGALAKVLQLQPRVWTWKTNGSDGQGFIAHELAEVCPDAVVGEKDAVDADGNPQYQGVDTSFLVATLTAAIQELKAINDAQASRIETLEAKVAALEANT